MIMREYLKLARSFNAVLTGISPVMGALAMGQYDIFLLFLLFLVGFFGHTFGFVLNDIVDYKIDRSSKEISDRPLISGTISLKNARLFAFISLLAAFVVSIYVAYETQNYFSIVILAISGFFITVYDLISKKYPLMDIFVVLGIFFLIFYGALIAAGTFSAITPLAWIVCVLGSIQALYMQIIAGGMKDVENDFKNGARTLAIKMGIRISNGDLNISFGFKALAYALQLVNILLVFLPFYFIWHIQNPTNLHYFQWISLGIIGLLMFFLSHKLLSMKKFERRKARKLIGSHYITNFTLVPIMLMTLNPWAGLLVFFPALGFILSNIILHGTILQPKTM